jgi:crossover junction endodeoxyribonuclease RusA
MTETAHAAGTLLVTIPGEPVPKGRPRFNPRSGRAVTPERTVSAESIVAWHVKEAAQQQGFVLPFQGNVYLSLGFGSKAQPGKEPDIDNLIKLVFDALNGVAYLDDKQVVILSASLGRRDLLADDTEPWTAIAIREERA